MDTVALSWAGLAGLVAVGCAAWMVAAVAVGVWLCHRLGAEDRARARELGRDPDER